MEETISKMNGKMANNSNNLPPQLDKTGEMKSVLQLMSGVPPKQTKTLDTQVTNNGNNQLSSSNNNNNNTTAVMTNHTNQLLEDSNTNLLLMTGTKTKFA